MAPPLRRPAVLVAALALLIPAASAHAAPAPGPVRVCPAPVRAGEATCDTTALAAPAATPEGWGAKDLQAAYRLQERAADAPGALVAVVVPYGNPAAESDLNA